MDSSGVLIMLFSPSTNGFYLPDTNTAPADAVAITQTVYEQLLSAQEQGLTITADAGGFPIAISVPPDPAEALATERAQMICSPMQGMLALGEARWQAVQDYRDNHATWAERVIIDRAGDWRRNSQNIAFFQYLLDMTDTEVDDLFRVAMEITA